MYGPIGLQGKRGDVGQKGDRGDTGDSWEPRTCSDVSNLMEAVREQRSLWGTNGLCTHVKKENICPSSPRPGV